LVDRKQGSINWFEWDLKPSWGGGDNMTCSLKILIIILAFIAITLLPCQLFADTQYPAKNNDELLESRSELIEFIAIRSIDNDMESLTSDIDDGSIYFGKMKDKGVGYRFVESLSADMLKNRILLKHADECDNEQSFEKNRFDIYDDEMMEIDSIRHDIAVEAISNATADTFEKTPIGKRVRELEDIVTSFFKIEYSKGITDKSGQLYLPGQVKKNPSEEEKDYNFTLSSFMYTDSDSFKGNFTAEMAIDYYTTEASLYYDFGKDKFAMSLTNEKINEKIGMDLGLMLIDEKEGETRGLIKLSMNF
jgi:hypothetical protein